MIFFLLDLFLSYVCPIATYFFLLNVILIPKGQLSKLIIITLIIDLLILNTYFLNTIIITIIFIIYKHLKIYRPTLLNYLISLGIIYLLYIFATGFINHYSFNYLLFYSLKNFGPNFIFYILCYKLLFKYIKLSR